MGITETPKTATTTTTTTTTTEAANESKKVLTLATFQDIFKHVEPEVRIEAFEVCVNVYMSSFLCIMFYLVS